MNNMSGILLREDDRNVNDKLYVVAGWELDLDSLIISLDSLHVELLSAMGYAHVPASLSLLEYAEQYVYPDDVMLIRNRFEYALSKREHPDYSDRFELRLQAVDGGVYYFIINSWSVRPGLIKGQGQNITDMKVMRNRFEDTASSLKAVIENTDDYIFIVNTSGELLMFNNNFSSVLRDFFNIEIEKGLNILEAIPGVLYDQWYPLLQLAIGGQRHMQEMDIKLKELHHIEISVNPILKKEEIVSVSFFIRDTTARWRLSKFDALEASVFEKAFKSKELKDIVDMLLEGMELLVPSMKCYITRKKKDALVLEWLSTPGLPVSYTSLINEISISEGLGSCGLAALTMEPVLISDVREHSCWDAYRDITLLAGFQACISFPVISHDGAVLGTMGAYFTEVHEISDYEMNLMMRAVNIVGVLMEKDNLSNEIHQQSNQLKELSASVPGLMFIVKMEKQGIRHFTYVSDNIEKYLNITREMALESYDDVLESVCEEDRKIFLTKLNESLVNKTVFEAEFRLRPDVKPEFHCFLAKEVHNFNVDGIVMSYGTVIDITSVKKAEAKLISRQRELETVINSIDDFLFVFDEQDCFVNVYCRNESSFPVPVEECIGRKMNEIFPIAVVEKYRTAKMELLSGEHPVEFMYEWPGEDAVSLFKARLNRMLDSSQLLFSSQEVVGEYTMNPINDTINELLSDASIMGPFGSFEYDPLNQCATWSPQLYTLAGVPEELSAPALYSYYLSSVHPDDVYRLKSRMDKSLKTGKSFKIEHRLKHGEGHYIWLRCLAKPETNPRTNEVVLKGFATDVSSVRMTELNLIRRTRVLDTISSSALTLLDTDNFTASLVEILNTISETFDVGVIRLNRHVLNQEDGRMKTMPWIELKHGRVIQYADAGIQPEQDDAKAKYGEGYTILSQGKPYCFDATTFDADEMSFLYDVEEKPLLLIPVFAGDDWWGVLELKERNEDSCWTDEDVLLLTSLTQFLGAVIVRNRTVNALRANNTLGNTALNGIEEGLLITNRGGDIVLCNRASCTQLGSSSEQLLGNNLNVLMTDRWSFYKEDGTLLKRSDNPLLNAILKMSPLTKTKLGVQTSESKRKWISWSLSLIPDPAGKNSNLMLISFSDTTEITERENQLELGYDHAQAALNSLKSRIKNERGLLSALMELQLLFSKDVQSKDLLRQLQSRIFAMDKLPLTSTSQIPALQLQTYLNEIFIAGETLWNTSDIKVSCQVKVEASDLTIPESVACGLILNELFTNAIVHGFKGRREGEINVKIQTQGDYHVMEISDDGIGFSGDFNWEDSKTMGFMLVKSLVTMLKGALTISPKNKTRIVITFPKTIR